MRGPRRILMASVKTKQIWSPEGRLTLEAPSVCACFYVPALNSGVLEAPSELLPELLHLDPDVEDGAGAFYRHLIVKGS